MEWFDGLDSRDRDILHVLSLYEGLDSLQLWYELGGSNGQLEHITRGELSDRLESLRSRGLVERITRSSEVDLGPDYWGYRLKKNLEG
jgi:DNA-binding HxlR family transcriptional regulator